MAPRVALVRFLLVLAAGAVFLVAPTPASAAKPCWQKVIDDWHDNGRIDQNYPIRCYRDALKHVPEDERDYTSIVDDINAKMQVSSRGTHQPGSGGGGSGGGTGGGSGGSGSGGHSAKHATHGTAPSKGSFKRASAKLDSSDANSLPLPLILLGSLALLLLGAAGGIRLFRYLQARGAGARPAPARDRG